MRDKYEKHGLRWVAHQTRVAADRLHLLVISTTVATFALILLGIYTAAVGAGLTCDARWPLCDGAVFGLFPANWPSFVEWFHRLVAMIVGFMILGSAYALYRRGVDRTVMAVMTGVVVLLPLQIWLGAETVLGYEVLVLILHFLTAFAIYLGLLYVTLRLIGRNRFGRRRIRRIGLLVLLLIPLLVLVSPTVIAAHSGLYQMAYNGIGLAIISLLILMIFGLQPLRPSRYRDDTAALITVSLLSITLLMMIFLLTIGRVTSVLGISQYTALSDLLIWPGAPILLVLVLVAVLQIGQIQPSRTN